MSWFKRKERPGKVALQALDEQVAQHAALEKERQAKYGSEWAAKEGQHFAVEPQKIAKGCVWDPTIQKIRRMTKDERVAYDAAQKVRERELWINSLTTEEEKAKCLAEWANMDAWDELEKAVEAKYRELNKTFQKRFRIAEMHERWDAPTQTVQNLFMVQVFDGYSAPKVERDITKPCPKIEDFEFPEIWSRVNDRLHRSEYYDSHFGQNRLSDLYKIYPTFAGAEAALKAYLHNRPIEPKNIVNYDNQGNAI